MSSKSTPLPPSSLPNITNNTTPSLESTLLHINIDQQYTAMAMDLHFCIYYTNGNKSNGNTKSNTTNEPASIIYQSFLQGLSNDIQRYQALQRVVCGHSACKEALLKSLQCSRTG